MIKNDVWVRLPQLTGEELTSMCSGLNLTVPETKKSTKSVLYSLVLQQLMSVDVEGLDEQEERDLFQNIQGSIEQLFKLREIKREQERRESGIDEHDAGSSVSGQTNVLNPQADVSLNGTAPVEPSALDNTGGGGTGNEQLLNVSTNSSSQGAVTTTLSQRFANLSANFASQSQVLALGENLGRRVAEASRSSDLGSLRLRREFRIDGTVGKGHKDSLSYSSLCYQIQQGKDAGYTTGEIRYAVAKAAKQGSFKSYLEGLQQAPEDKFLEALQIIYNEKKAFKMLNEMSRCYQNDAQALETGEDEVQFCMRMFGYCDQIRKISSEEGQPIDEQLIKDTLYSSLSTGFKQGAVRLELQQTLNNCTLDNNSLLKEVTRVMNKEIEHKSKMEGEKKHVSVNEVDILNGRDSFSDDRRGGVHEKKGESKEDKMFSVITNLSLQMSELSDLTKRRESEMEELKKKLERCEARLNSQDKKPKNKCPTCEARKARFCPHCLGCGAEGHKKNDKECPLNS